MLKSGTIMDRNFQAVGYMPNLKSPIFVVGNVHSVTTLTRGIIGRHPSVFCGRGETRFFYHLVGIQRRYPDLTNAATRQKFIEFGLRTISAGYGTVKDADEAGQSIDLIKYGITMTDLEELQKRLAGVSNHDRAYVMIYDFLTEKVGACR